MKREADDAMLEIKRRGSLIRRRREQRITQMLSAASFVMAFALIGVLSVMMGSGIVQTRSDYGSIRLSVEQCGYILVAVLALSLGIVLTLMIQRYRRKDNLNTDDNGTDN